MNFRFIFYVELEYLYLYKYLFDNKTYFIKSIATLDPAEKEVIHDVAEHNNKTNPNTTPK